MKDNLAQELDQFAKQGDFSKLPLRLPTFTLALGAISRIAGGMELSGEAVRMLELNRDKFFLAKGSLEGWGYYEQFDWGVTEVGAWVALAEIQSLRATNPPVWTTPMQREEVKRIVRDVITLLGKRQLPQIGAFSPIADTSDIGFARSYSTVMSLWAMAEAVSPELGIYQDSEVAELDMRMNEAVKWLWSSVVQDKKGPIGWKVNPGNPAGEDPFLGLTAQTLCVLGRVPIHIDRQSQNKFAEMKKRLLSGASEWGRRDLKLNGRMHDADCYLYPTQTVIEPSTFLWYPWCVSLLRSYSTDTALTTKERHAATRWLKRMHARAGEFGNIVDSEYNYVAAETLIGFDWPVDVRNKATHNPKAE